MAITPPNQRPAPPPPDARKQFSTFITIFLFVFVLFLLFDTSLRTWFGSIVGVVLNPIFGLNYQYVVVTLMLAGLLMTGLTTVVRHFTTNYVEQAENQQMMSAFNKEFRKATLENNKYKIKKLSEEQKKIMEKSMAMSTGQLKMMPYTMAIAIPILAWLAVFMAAAGTGAFVNLPWATNVALNTSPYLLPNWVILYSLVSIPFGQILLRALRYFEFRSRLKELKAVA